MIKVLLSFITFIQFVSAQTFEVTYPVPEQAPAYTPRVYIALSQGFLSPRSRMDDWGNLPILFAVDDTDRDGKVVIDEKSLGSIPMAQVNGRYKVQAIVRINPDWFLPGSGEGDLFSKIQMVTFNAGKKNHHKLHADLVVEAPEFRSKGLVQDHYFKSETLSAFHQREFKMRYSVLLPDGWDADDPNKKYPVIVYVTGFTGVHHTATHRIRHLFGDKGHQAIIVIPDANCRWGHSVFANSAVNGPWGDALTEELLPHIDKTYHGAGPKHRYITGVSSGGWTAAWQIINYPDAYAEAWPVAPDPVDFEAFQEMNFTDKKEENLYTVRRKGKVQERFISLPLLEMDYRTMARFEHVLGAGGQLQSFGAVFSPKRLKNGEPVAWYDPDTGTIKRDVTDAWAPYDIAKILQKNWDTLGPKLKGKIHFGIHEKDMFHLDHAIRMLEKKCKLLGSDARFTYFHGMGHHMPLDHAEKMMNSVLDRWNRAKQSKNKP